MFKKHLDRIIAMLIASGLPALIVACDLLKKHQMGREVFLQREGKYFDKYISNFSHPLAHAIGYAIFFAVFFLSYELIVFIIRRCYIMIQSKNQGKHA